MFSCESRFVEVLTDAVPCIQVGKKRGLPYTGLSAFLSTLETSEEYQEINSKFQPIEQRKERRVRIAEERHERAKTVFHPSRRVDVQWFASGSLAAS